MPLMKCARCDRLMVSDQSVCTPCRKATVRSQNYRHLRIVSPGLILLMTVPMSYAFGPPLRRFSSLDLASCFSCGANANLAVSPISSKAGRVQQLGRRCCIRRAEVTVWTSQAHVDTNLEEWRPQARHRR